MVKEGKFREDLFYRLNVFPIEIPPLRRRRDDVPDLARFFLARYAREAAKPRLKDFSTDALARLVAYQWPGNVRELENVVERSVIMAASDLVSASDLLFFDGSVGRDAPPIAAERPAPQQGGPALPAVLEKLEREELIRAMDQAGGSKAKAARALGVNRSTLYYRLRKQGLAERYGLPALEGGGDEAEVDEAS
jgi:DNA-binding NtrC family response regulator